MSKHMINKIHTWKNDTTQGAAISAAVEAALAYGFASWSITSGSLFLYAATLLLVIGSVRNFINLIKLLVRSPKASTKK